VHEASHLITGLVVAVMFVASAAAQFAALLFRLGEEA
jgi:hypothetical protein